MCIRKGHKVRLDEKLLISLRMKEAQQTKETGQQYNSQTHTNVPTHEHQVHLSPPQFLHTNALFSLPSHSPRLFYQSENKE